MEIEKMMCKSVDNAPEGWGMHVTCPYCKSDYTHIEDINHRYSDAWEGRGDAARIAMFCEHCPNLFYVRVGEHKGFCYLEIEKSYNLAKFHEPK